MLKLRACALTAVVVSVAAAEPAAARAESDVSQPRFRACMGGGNFDCMRRVIEGDIPYAVFRDRSGRRPWVRVCVRDREGRRCWPRQRAGKRGFVRIPILYRTTGKHVTTWRVKGEVVRRWRWRVKPEPE